MEEQEIPAQIRFKILDEFKSEPQKFTIEKRVCEKHGEYECKVSENGVAFPCPKCAEEFDKRRQEEERIRNQKMIEETERESKKEWSIKGNVSPEFYYAELKDFIPKTKAQETAKNAIQKMIETHKGKVILLGSNGAGKTMLASIAARDLRGAIYTVYEIATMIRQSYTVKAEKSELEIVKGLIDLPFLAIDEVGRIANSEAVQNWFSFILDKRHSRDLPTVIIGNLHFKKECKKGGCSKCFENYFDEDVLSRFHENTTVVMIKASDERREKNTVIFSKDE